MLVLALRIAYLGALAFGVLTPREQIFLALAAYTSYAINATGFRLRLRAARREPISPAREPRVMVRAAE